MIWPAKTLHCQHVQLKIHPKLWHQALYTIQWNVLATKYWSLWNFPFDWSSMWSARPSAQKHGFRSSSKSTQFSAVAFEFFLFFLIMGLRKIPVNFWTGRLFQMGWTELKNFLALPRQPLYCGSAGATKGFVRSYKNLHFYWILGAGHFVSNSFDSALLLQPTNYPEENSRHYRDFASVLFFI